MLMTYRRTIFVSAAVIAVTSVATAQYGTTRNPSTQPATQTPPLPAVANTPKPALPEVDPRWLEKLQNEDRAALEEIRGYAPPAFTEDLKWIGATPTQWEALRGKVIVVQAWTTGTTGGRMWPTRVANALKDFAVNDVHLIALHTPEKAEDAEDFMARQKPPERAQVVIDPSGRFCDALGIYKHPVNLVIDRNGMVRFVGLNLNGLKNAVTELVAEQADATKIAPAKPQPAEVKVVGPQYPPTTERVTGAADLRGKEGPNFVFDSWYTNAPNSAPVVMLTFFSIEDAASLATHPFLNELTDRFGQQIACVVISQESKSQFEERMLKRRMDKNDFRYAVALDRHRRTATAMSVQTLPYTIVMSRDGIVRWQGRTGELSAAILQQIIEADAAATATGGAGKRRGWVQG